MGFSESHEQRQVFGAKVKGRKAVCCDFRCQTTSANLGFQDSGSLHLPRQRMCAFCRGGVPIGVWGDTGVI